MEVKCECGYEYSMDIEDGDWQTCVNCDLPYKHIRKSKWISVEDRMPPNDHVNNYLVYDKTFGVVVSFYNPSDNKWKRLFHGLTNTEFEDVTHWQPRPDPPEENDE